MDFTPYQSAKKIKIIHKASQAKNQVEEYEAQFPQFQKYIDRLGSVRILAIFACHIACSNFPTFVVIMFNPFWDTRPLRFLLFFSFLSNNCTTNSVGEGTCLRVGCVFPIFNTDHNLGLVMLRAITIHIFSNPCSYAFKKGQTIFLNIKVSPNKPTTKIQATDKPQLMIDIAKAAENGQANEELLCFLQENVGRVKLVSGHTSRRKIVELQGYKDVEAVLRIIKNLQDK